MPSEFSKSSHLLRSSRPQASSLNTNLVTLVPPNDRRPSAFVFKMEISSFPFSHCLVSLCPSHFPISCLSPSPCTGTAFPYWIGRSLALISTHTVRPQVMYLRGSGTPEEEAVCLRYRLAPRAEAFSLSTAKRAHLFGWHDLILSGLTLWVVLIAYDAPSPLLLLSSPRPSKAVPLFAL